MKRDSEENEQLPLDFLRQRVVCLFVSSELSKTGLVVLGDDKLQEKKHTATPKVSNKIRIGSP
jgi:hypothetical protein